jgi:hypothetical protein
LGHAAFRSKTTGDFHPIAACLRLGLSLPTKKVLRKQLYQRCASTPQANLRALMLRRLQEP